jgi:transcriptional regulator with XRE-family HTH domain
VVPDPGSLKISRRRLAAELRRLRELAGMTGDEVADQLGWSGSKVSRIELNRTEVKAGDLAKLLDLYEIGGDQRDELLTLVKAPRTRGWWEAYSDVVRPDYAAYIELEAEADAALCWSTMLVYGLLQTQEYARAAIESHLEWLPVTPAARVRRTIEVRLARQRRITDAERPLELTVVLDESVLLRKIADKVIMQGQLRHLMSMAELPNVRLHVLPLAGPHPIATGSFILLGFPAVLGAGPASDVAYVEQLTRNEVYADDEAEIYEYRLAFEQLVAQSLDPEQSRDLIARVIEEVWS